MAEVKRHGTVKRKTRETSISVDLTIDGRGNADIHTGIPFFDHMLVLFTVHGLFDVTVRATGDLDVDGHHTVEDVGICLGRAFNSALGDRTGIRRYGTSTVPMDETLAQVALDLSNRPYLVCHLPELVDRIGTFETELIPEFFRAFAVHAGATLHIRVPYGKNSHHIVEAVFKAWGRAMDEATLLDPRRGEIPSSKGVL